MKKITLMLATMAAMVATSCQKSDLDAPSGEEQKIDAAYITLSLDTSATRAGEDGTTDTGTDDENLVSTLALIAFDYNYDYIGAYSVTVSSTASVFNCEVAPDAYRFFAVVNPTSNIWDAINAVSSFSQAAFSALPAITMTAASVSTDNNSSSGTYRGFTMVNCGAMDASGILLESLVSVKNPLSTDEDNPTELTIAVDRMVSKFQYSVNSAFDENTADKFDTAAAGAAEPLGEVLGVALTATNRASYLYSMIATNTLLNSNVYRSDHNMTIAQIETEAEKIIAEMEANFYWLKNESATTDAAFYSAGTVEYVLENTCEPSCSNSNNLTQAIVKATYNPVMSDGSVLALGTSWFKIYTTGGEGTLYLEFDDVVSFYKGEYESFDTSTGTQASMDAQLDNILGTSGNSWADEDLKLSKLDGCSYGGYKAATVDSSDDYVVQYFQKAINYYDIFIQHDETQEIGHMGRWGMVRNNSYSMDITGISQEGLPYIPDPTDPTIVDPENQDPTNPEPADPMNAYINVTISVNPWVIWSQSSPLL